MIAQLAMAILVQGLLLLPTCWLLLVQKTPTHSCTVSTTLARHADHGEAPARVHVTTSSDAIERDERSAGTNHVHVLRIIIATPSAQSVHQTNVLSQKVALHYHLYAAGGHMLPGLFPVTPCGLSHSALPRSPIARQMPKRIDVHDDGRIGLVPPPQRQVRSWCLYGGHAQTVPSA